MKLAAIAECIYFEIALQLPHIASGERGQADISPAKAHAIASALTTVIESATEARRGISLPSPLTQRIRRYLMPREDNCIKVEQAFVKGESACAGRLMAVNIISAGI